MRALKLFLALGSSIVLVCVAASAAATNLLVWDSVDKVTDLPAMTNVAYFTFWLTNNSPDEATIFSTETSCDCTVAEAGEKLPWKIPPGGSGWLKARVNTLGKFGAVMKTIAVNTSRGTQMLSIHVKIPITPAPFNVSVRQKDVMTAKADRQSVFRDHCAACHTWPAAHQTGAVLFEKACGICHISEHRAEMVPDLAALKHPTDADFWRVTIMHGKTNTLMPAFAIAEGGILDTNQIESLVDYLVKNYPSRGPAPDPTDYLLK